MLTVGYKTKGKQAIIDYIESQGNKSFTVKQLFYHLQKNSIDLNISTLYRFLNKLEEEKFLIKHINKSGKEACFQYINKNEACFDHLHIQCIKCSQTLHLDCEYMHRLYDHILNEHGFKLKYEKSILYGTCKKCSNLP
ncbi:MAG: hypothetical protein GYA87_06485 [Christensenellaceae bacterium]|nr:hypothetical protein [Christensenellaceae bacterium]